MFYHGFASMKSNRGRIPGKGESVMAGLVPATHAVRNDEQVQVFCVFQPNFYYYKMLRSEWPNPESDFCSMTTWMAGDPRV